MFASISLISAMSLGLAQAATIATTRNITLGRRQDGLTAQLTIGSESIPFAGISPADRVLRPGLEDLCASDFGCDNGRKWTSETWVVRFNGRPDPDPEKIACSWSVEAQGNFDSTDERDYMIDLMVKTIEETQEVEETEMPIETTICPPACDWEPWELYTAVNYLQIVLNGENGENHGELQATMSLDCKDESGGFDCPAIVKENLKDALSAVPGVGDVIAQVFNFACA
ncbi:hypothetical protein V8F20_009388 [Naviculisporaceae sp. PSN 640]